jgi:hypothetical protein
MGVVSRIANPPDMCVSSQIHFITEYLIKTNTLFIGGVFIFYSKCTTEVSSIEFKIS